MEEEVGENEKNEFTKKEEAADCDNGGEGALARLLEFVFPGGLHIQASPEYAALVDSGPSVLDPTA
ncbi:hypothetical protein N7501_011939 [Penicillium viridicatum]|nr:hypothetical protein N7501_011939 [Penicillium viridicatum]